MWTKWIEGQWAVGRFYFLSALLILLQASGYFELFPGLLKLVLFADVYGLLTVFSWRMTERRGVEHLAFQSVSVGLIITALVAVWPASLPLAVPHLFDLLGMSGWQEVLTVCASVAGSAGWVLHRFAPSPTALRPTLRLENQTGPTAPVSAQG